MTSEETVNKSLDNLSMDGYSDAHRKFVVSRTAEDSAAFFLPHIRPNIRLLDCGCGEGTITVGLAETVAPGEVIGIDVSPKAIESARKLVEKRGLPNVRIEMENVYDLPFPDESFDAVFAHTLFEYLKDKPRAITQIRRVLRPGGVVGIRSPIWDSKIMEPTDPLLERFWKLMIKIRDGLGGDSSVGRRLTGILKRGGFKRVEASASFVCYSTDERKRWYADLWGTVAFDHQYATELIQRGWAKREELEQMSAAFKSWAEKSDAFMADPYGEAIGWKE